MTARDWASLPPHLLCSVAERLIPVVYARLRAVCTAWASAVSPEEWEEGQCQSYYLPRSLYCPWLMVLSEHEQFTGFLTFLSLPESLCPYRIAAPNLLRNNYYIIGSHADWLAAVDAECNVSLINPLTHVHIPLPSVTTINIPGLHHVEVVRDSTSGSPIMFHSYGLSGESEDYTPEEFRLIYFRKIILSSSPSSSWDDYIAVFRFDYADFLAFARAGDTAWTVLDRVPPENYGYMDAVFLDQKLYAAAANGQIEVFDFSQSKPGPTVLAERITEFGIQQSRYLVFSSGDLLHVQRIAKEDDVLGFKTSGFTIEKINLVEAGEKHWNREPVNDLGCRSLFVGMSQSLSISTQEISGVRQNCIYFTDDYLDWLNGEGKQCIRDMGIFAVKEGSCEPLYPPQAWLTWPPPIWFTPVLN